MQRRRPGEDSETLFYSGLAHLTNLGSDDEEAIDYSYKKESRSQSKTNSRISLVPISYKKNSVQGASSLSEAG